MKKLKASSADNGSSNLAEENSRISNDPSKAYKCLLFLLISSIIIVGLAIGLNFECVHTLSPRMEYFYATYDDLYVKYDTDVLISKENFWDSVEICCFLEKRRGFTNDTLELYHDSIILE